MNFDFDSIISRSNTNSVKYDFLSEYFPGADASVLPLWVADMDFLSPRPIIEGLKKRAEHGIFGYSHYPGSYYNAILSWFQRKYGAVIDRSWIVHSPGVLSGIDAAIQGLTNPKDEILIQPPVYYPFFECIRGNGRNLVENPLIFKEGKYRMDFEKLRILLESRAIKMMILCSPHNPVGRVWSESELSELWNLLKQKNVILISDEIHCDLRYPNIPFHSMLKIVNSHENLIVCTSASKTFNLAGLQLSNLIVPNAQYRDTIKKVLRAIGLVHPNCFSPIATEIAYSDPECERWLDNMIDYIKGNLAFMKTYISQRLPKIQIIEPEGTYLVWLDFRSFDLPASEINKIIEKDAKIALDDGAIFGTGGMGFQRINIACPRSILKTALERLYEAFKPYL